MSTNERCVEMIIDALMENILAKELKPEDLRPAAVAIVRLVAALVVDDLVGAWPRQ